MYPSLGTPDLVDPEIAKVALKYFNEHALQWLTLRNVAVHVFAEVPPYTVEVENRVIFWI